MLLFVVKFKVRGTTMPDSSKFATLGFFGYSCAMAAMFYGFIHPSDAFIATMIALFGISLVVTENVKECCRWGKIFHGLHLAFVWPMIITFAARGAAIAGSYKDTNTTNDYISLALLLGFITTYVCIPAIILSEIWESCKFKIRQRHPSIPAELKGNHVAIVVSGIVIVGLTAAVHLTS